MAYPSIPDKVLLPYALEATASTVAASTTVTRRILNGYIVNDGAVDITFTVTPNTDLTTVAFTLKASEINEVPFTFTAIEYVTTTSSAAFRLFGTQY